MSVGGFIETALKLTLFLGALAAVALAAETSGLRAEILEAVMDRDAR